jgi:thioredoxin reductase (NADPH)
MDRQNTTPLGPSSSAADNPIRPAVLAVDEDRESLARIEAELAHRFGADYRIVCERSPADALRVLTRMRTEGDPVALVLAYEGMGELRGAELLDRVKALHPHAKRALLIDWGGWGDRETAEAIVRSMALGGIDYYVLKPWRSPDELFNRTIAEFLHEWSQSAPVAAQVVTLVGGQWSAEAHNLRNLVAQTGIPHAFYSQDSDAGRRALREAGLEGVTEPVVILYDGRTLIAPTELELASAWGVKTELEPGVRYDVAVVGAGPAGLAAAVYAASEGLQTLVVERATLGGQAGSTSLIRNYLGFPRGVSGSELAQRAYQQAWVFGTDLLFMREATRLEPGGEFHVLEVSDHSSVGARTVVLATGVAYRRLEAPSIEALSGVGVYYGAAVSEARGMAGLSVYVIGGGNSAGQAAVYLSAWASDVTLVVRGETLEDTMSQYLQDEISALENVQVRLNSEVVEAIGETRLERVIVRDRESGEETEEDAAAMFVLIGARPNTGWLPPAIERDRGGYVLTGLSRGSDGCFFEWPLDRAPLPYESTVPGIFAVGDVRSGAVKRVASAVGEGSVVVSQLHQLLDAGEPSGEAAAWR